jgi:hypothetical protein
MDGELFNPTIGNVASILAIGGFGFTLGRYLGRRDIIRQQPQLEEVLVIEEAIKHFQAKIKWINDMKTDLNDRINMGKLSRQEEDVYRNWIADLDIQIRTLERSLDDISEKKPKGSG